MTHLKENDNGDHIIYEVITLEDLDEVNDLLVCEFFRTEPLGNHLGANPELDVRPWISKVTKPLIEQGISFKASRISGDGGSKIIGALMNKVVYKDDSKNIPGFSEALTDEPNNFMWDILNLMDDLYKDVNLFTKFNVDQMVVFNMISVSEHFAGMGIGKKLAQTSENYIRSERSHIRLISAETTGALSAKIFARLGFEEVTRIIYDGYNDKHDKRVFQNIKPPHLACIVWAKAFMD